MREDHFDTDLLYDMNHSEELARESYFDFLDQQEKDYPPDDFTTCARCGGEIEYDEECDCDDEDGDFADDAHLDSWFDGRFDE